MTCNNNTAVGWTDKMPQQTNIIASKPDDLSSLPRTYMRRESSPVGYPLISTSTPW